MQRLDQPARFRVISGLEVVDGARRHSQERGSTPLGLLTLVLGQQVPPTDYTRLIHPGGNQPRSDRRRLRLLSLIPGIACHPFFAPRL